MRLKRFLYSGSIIAGMITFLFGYLFYKRQLPYNSEGNYFDPIASVTYHEQSMITFGALAFVFGLAGLVLFFRAKKV